jgi:hypothetical protein
MATVPELDVRVSSHEAVCEVRYESINARLKRIEQIGISVAGFIIALLLHIIMKA